jgi:hypothetical protein
MPFSGGETVRLANLRRMFKRPRLLELQNRTVFVSLVLAMKASGPSVQPSSWRLAHELPICGHHLGEGRVLTAEKDRGIAWNRRLCRAFVGLEHD